MSEHEYIWEILDGGHHTIKSGFPSSEAAHAWLRNQTNDEHWLWFVVRVRLR